MPSGSPHSLRRSCRPALRLLATLLLALALAEPAFAGSFGAEELREAEAVLAAGGVEAPAEVTVPEVAGPDMAVPEVAVPDVAVADTVEAVEVREPAVPEPVEPSPEAAPAPAAEATPAPSAERRAVLGSGDPAAKLAAAPSERATKAEDAASEALALMRDEAGAQLQDLGAAVAAMKGEVASMKGEVASMKTAVASIKGEVSQLNGGFDWTLNRSSGCGGVSAAGLGSNWTLGGACPPQNLRGNWLGGDRPIEDRLGGLLEALLPEGMSLGEAAGGLELPGSGPLRHRSEGRRSPVAGDAADDLGVSSAPAPPGGGGLAELSRASAGGARSPVSADSTSGGASGPGPVRDPVGEPPEPLAAAAGLAPGTGGGGGGGAFVLLIAALVGGLALLPPPPGERVHALARRLTSLLSSSRLERPG
jgi:hypothetical protein